MSIVERAKRFFGREASSKLNWTSTTSKNAPPTFVPDLIRGQTWVVTEFDHLDKVARYDPVGKFLTYGMAERTFDDWFVLRNKQGDEVMQETMRQLERLNAPRVFTQAYAMAMAHGWSWLYTGKNKYVPESGEGGRIATLVAFNRKQCTVYEYNDVGQPVRMKVELQVGRGNHFEQETLYLPAEDFVHVCPNPVGTGLEGRSELEAPWDMLTYNRYEFHSMTFYDIKIGHGLFAAFMKGGFSDDTVSKWNAAFEDISIKRAMVLSDEVSDVKFIGPSGQATDFEKHINCVLEQIAVATEIPASLLKGVGQGEVTGSETNLKLGEVMERRYQKKAMPFIREVIKKMGFNNRDYVIEFNVKYAQDEEEQAKIAQTKAQAMATKMAYMTIDEVRAEEGLPPLPDGRGEGLAADFTINMSGFQSPEEADKTNNPEGKQL